MRNRIEQTRETGAMAGREDLFPALWSMFLERPLLGWGPVTNHYEVAARTPSLQGRQKRDSHNLVLETMTATGAIGTIPFAIGLTVVVAAAWRARGRRHGVLPLVLVAAALAANMSGNYIAWKYFWLVMAYAVAASTFAPGQGSAPPPAGGSPASAAAPPLTHRGTGPGRWRR
jgi:O-antigen ligase